MMRKNIGSHVDVNDVKAIFDNLLLLEIFYNEFNYEEIKETPGYSVYCGLSCSPSFVKLSLALPVLSDCQSFKYVGLLARDLH